MNIIHRIALRKLAAAQPVPYTQEELDVIHNDYNEYKDWYIRNRMVGSDGATVQGAMPDIEEWYDADRYNATFPKQNTNNAATRRSTVGYTAPNATPIIRGMTSGALLGQYGGKLANQQRMRNELNNYRPVGRGSAREALQTIGNLFSR